MTRVRLCTLQRQLLLAPPPLVQPRQAATPQAPQRQPLLQVVRVQHMPSLFTEPCRSSLSMNAWACITLGQFLLSRCIVYTCVLQTQASCWSCNNASVRSQCTCRPIIYRPVVDICCAPCAGSSPSPVLVPATTKFVDPVVTKKVIDPAPKKVKKVRRLWRSSA
jgi:hypothetical protein